MADLKISSAAQKSLNLLPGTKFYSPFPFGGMNAEASPLAIGDEEFVWIENCIRIGPGRFRAAWDASAPFYTAAGASIVSFTFFNIGSTYYVLIFLDNGQAVQINVDSLVQTPVSGLGRFYVVGGAGLPATSQWGTLYLLISNRNTPNDYWAWDGSLLYGAGTAAPNGVTLTSTGKGYTGTPTITAFGGQGSGLVVVPSMNGGGVVNLQITNPGNSYLVGDTVQLAFSGGGSDTSAILQAVLTASTVADAVILAKGSGYTHASVGFTSGSGSGATGTAVISGGQVVEILITNPGSGYTSAPRITITGDGAGAVAQAVLSPVNVASVHVVNPGSGFLYAPNITFVGGGGVGAAGIVQLTATSISRVSVVSGGQNYVTPPTVSFAGGGGTGATATAVLAGGQVVAVTVTAPGSGYTTNPEVLFTPATSDPGTGAGAVAILVASTIGGVIMSNTGLGYTDAPAIVIDPGANNAAYAIVTLMPYGVSGSSMETFQNRLWIANPAPSLFGTIPPGGNFAVSSPGNFTDFATSDGGLIFTNSDSFLQAQYVNIKQSSGYLYFFGDGSVSVVSNVQSTGSPVSTTFNYQNVDPQGGLSWRDSAQAFGRSIVVANETGIYGLYGGALTKISEKLDQLFTTAIFPPVPDVVTPSSATATLFNVKHYLCLMTVIDQDLNESRKVMVTWNEKDWVLTSQSVDLIYIGPEKRRSLYTAWGTDGTSLYQLFATPSGLTKRLHTKHFGAPQSFLIKQLDSFFIQAQEYEHTGLTIDVDFVVDGLAVQNPNGGEVPSGIYSMTMPPSFSANPPEWPAYGAQTGNIPFVTVGARLTSTSPDFVIANFMIAYIDLVANR